jgi:hypothetical protein
MEWNNFESFIYGLVIGYFWHPVWNITKKIWIEAKIAKDEWSRPK